MSQIMEKYSVIQKHLFDINERYKAAERHLSDFKQEDDVVRQARIDNLDKQLKDIGPYYARVEYFRQLAEKNITSKNILSLKALELDFNSLRHDAARIDTQNPNDPYAYRLYVHTRCNEIYLEEKQKEFEEKKALLLSGKNDALEKLKEQVEKTKAQLECECELYVRSAEFDEFSVLLQRVHYNQSEVMYTDEGLQGSRAFEWKDKTVSIGAVAQPLIILGEEAIKSAKVRLGKYFDEKSQSVLLPIEYDSSEEILLNIATATSKENRCFKGLSNLLLNLIKRTQPGNRKFKISFIDAVHFNNSQLKVLRPLEDSAVLNKIPVNDEEVADQLRQIVASFPDIDEKLQDYESVKEYNENVKDEKDKIARRVVCLVGYPNSFDNSLKNYINRIIYNHQRYGITVVLVNNTGYSDEINKKDKVSNKLSNNYYNITMPQGKSSTIDRGDDLKLGFRWYEYNYKDHPLPESYVEDIRLDDEISNGVENEYIKLYPLEEWAYKDRNDETRKNIKLPYGVDAEGNISEVSFEAESFAAYLMGASGSGKSTLLHALITGIIRNYHPDDVELWLADFKMAEFSQYINPLPPHVKYILLDESRELVFDLVDKLTEEMFKRQKYFMQHREISKVEDVPSNVHMPVIFIMLDEFSIMSQVLENDEIYKLKLQNLLAKGRALGMKFIFSSQSYMKGIKGLTATAKEQIQTRIAMHNNKDEIEETLELPRFLKTEQNIFMIETLPAHMALRKYHKSENELVLERVKGLYFKGKGEEAYKPQRKLIEQVNKKLNMIELEDYTGKSSSSYVNKNTVIVNGNSYDAFDDDVIMHERNNISTNSVYDDDVRVSFGRPRRMENYIFESISKESRENILLVARSNEYACATSIILSVIKTYLLYDKKVEIWTYEKNKLFLEYQDIFINLNVKIIQGIDDICNNIRNIKDSILNNYNENKMIILIGIDHICIDFDYVANTENKSSTDSKKGAVASQEDLINKQLADDFFKVWTPIHETLKNQGKTSDEIKAIRKERKKEFMMEREYVKNDTSQEAKNTITSQDQTKVTIPQEQVKGAYNAKEDFDFIVKHGSRLGFHFMMLLNNISDFKTTGLKMEYYRFKMSFMSSVDDSRLMFNNRSSSNLPEHVCQFDNTLEQYSFRPYLHEGIEWDGWYVENGVVKNPYEEVKED